MLWRLLEAPPAQERPPIQAAKRERQLLALIPPVKQVAGVEEQRPLSVTQPAAAELSVVPAGNQQSLLPKTRLLQAAPSADPRP